MITELDIVNDMLATMGVAPLNEINEDNPDIAGCRRIIRKESLKVQQKSWWFNLERIDLYPDSISKFIYSPEDTIRCSPIRKPPSMSITARGRRLYNNDTNSYKFDHSVECWLVRDIPFVDLPVSAKAAISIAAVRKFQQSFDADRAKMEQLNVEYFAAMADLNSEHIRNINVNLIEKNSTLRILNGIKGGNQYRR